jgi:hypothetical protein
MSAPSIIQQLIQTSFLKAMIDYMDPSAIQDTGVFTRIEQLEQEITKSFPSSFTHPTHGFAHLFQTYPIQIEYFHAILNDSTIDTHIRNGDLPHKNTVTMKNIIFLAPLLCVMARASVHTYNCIDILTNPLYYNLHMHFYNNYSVYNSTAFTKYLAQTNKSENDQLLAAYLNSRFTEIPFFQPTASARLQTLAGRQRVTFAQPNNPPAVSPYANTASAPLYSNALVGQPSYTHNTPIQFPRQNGRTPRFSQPARDIIQGDFNALADILNKPFPTDQEQDDAIRTFFEQVATIKDTEPHIWRKTVYHDNQVEYELETNPREYYIFSNAIIEAANDVIDEASDRNDLKTRIWGILQTYCFVNSASNT